jgi:tetratricopeptide (TPR) repeat protein
VTYYEQALHALQQLPDSCTTRELAIDLRFDMRHALSLLGEFRRLLDHLRQAEPLAEALGDCRRQGQLASYIAACLMQLGDPDGGLASAQRALALATALGEVGLHVTANYYLGEVYLYGLNDYQRAAEVLRRNVATLHGTPLQERFGGAGIPSVSSHALLVMCLAELGVFAEGRAYGEEALPLAEAVKHPYSLASVYTAVGHLALCQGALLQAICVLERGRALSDAVHLPIIIQACSARLGAAYTLAGRVSAALPLLMRALEQNVAMGYTIGYPPYAVWLGEGYVLAGRVAEALPLGQRALEVAQAQKQQGWQAYALRLLGEITVQGECPDVEQATVYYRHALTLAEALGMRPLQAHCHRGLGMLYGRIGWGAQARAELATAITLYRSMNMTFWLPQAEAALAQMDVS